MRTSVLETIPWASDLHAAASAYAGRVAVDDGDRTIDFSALTGRAAQVAHLLRDRGLAPGTPVATSLRNSIPAVWAAMGLRLAGMADTALNASMTDAERAYCIRLSGARHVLTTAAQASAFRDLGCEAVAIDELPDERSGVEGLPPVPAEAWGRISFTSGTTGRPKAIVTTHGARWIAALLQRANLPEKLLQDSRILLMTPFVHGAGILTQAFNESGASALLLDGVNIEKVLPLLVRVDHIFAPPTVLAKLVAALDGQRVPGIRAIFTGTAPLLPSLYFKAREIFGPVIRVTYGKSEINNPITMLTADQCNAYYNEPPEGDGVCVGFPGTGVEISVRDDQGSQVSRAEVGEVHLRGRHMSAGFIDPDGAFHLWGEDGFHATGDLGRIDARGRLHLVGRVADVIKSGGYKVHPDEIERALAGTAGTGAVAIVSLPSEYWGEVIVAVAETGDPDWPERARAALADLARHKHPRALLTWPDLPRNAQGKIMRRTIRERLLEQHRLEDGPYPKLVPK